MTARLRRTVARILRVDHAGEHGAIAIYGAQIALARLLCPDLLPFLTEARAHEVVHRKAFHALMPNRACRPSQALWIWRLGGTALGFMTAMLGRQGILICTEAVERVVHEHLDDQLRFLDQHDPAVAAIVREIQIEELQHLGFAQAALEDLTGVWRLVSVVVAGLTDLMIFLSTEGESATLGRGLAPSK